VEVGRHRRGRRGSEAGAVQRRQRRRRHVRWRGGAAASAWFGITQRNRPRETTTPRQPARAAAASTRQALSRSMKLAGAIRRPTAATARGGRRSERGTSRSRPPAPPRAPPRAMESAVSMCACEAWRTALRCPHMAAGRSHRIARSLSDGRKRAPRRWHRSTARHQQRRRRLVLRLWQRATGPRARVQHAAPTRKRPRCNRQRSSDRGALAAAPSPHS